MVWIWVLHSLMVTLFWWVRSVYAHGGVEHFKRSSGHLAESTTSCLDFYVFICYTFVQYMVCIWINVVKVVPTFAICIPNFILHRGLLLTLSTTCNQDNRPTADIHLIKLTFHQPNYVSRWQLKHGFSSTCIQDIERDDELLLLHFQRITNKYLYWIYCL